MANTQHHSLTKFAVEDDVQNNRDSEFGFSNREISAQQDRYSDYQQPPNEASDRSSNAIVYESDDVRFSATSDRIVARRRGIRSNNRVSSIYGGTLTSWAEAGPANSLLNFSIAEDVEDKAHDDADAESVDRELTDKDSTHDRGEDPQNPVTGETDWFKTSGHRNDLPGDITVPDPLSKTTSLPVSASCEPVLHSLLFTYEINASIWQRYRICIAYKQGAEEWERTVQPKEAPLMIYSNLLRRGMSARFILRNFSATTENARKEPVEAELTTLLEEMQGTLGAAAQAVQGLESRERTTRTSSHAKSQANPQASSMQATTTRPIRKEVRAKANMNASSRWQLPAMNQSSETLAGSISSLFPLSTSSSQESVSHNSTTSPYADHDGVQFMAISIGERSILSAKNSGRSIYGKPALAYGSGQIYSILWPKVPMLFLQSLPAQWLARSFGSSAPSVTGWVDAWDFLDFPLSLHAETKEHLLDTGFAFELFLHGAVVCSPETMRRVTAYEEGPMNILLVVGSFTNIVPASPTDKNKFYAVLNFVSQRGIDSVTQCSVYPSHLDIEVRMALRRNGNQVYYLFNDPIQPDLWLPWANLQDAILGGRYE